MLKYCLRNSDKTYHVLTDVCKIYEESDKFPSNNYSKWKWIQLFNCRVDASKVDVDDGKLENRLKYFFFDD